MSRNLASVIVRCRMMCGSSSSISGLPSSSLVTSYGAHAYSHSSTPGIRPPPLVSWESEVDSPSPPGTAGRAASRPKPQERAHRDRVGLVVVLRRGDAIEERIDVLPDAAPQIALRGQPPPEPAHRVP